jgi:selenide,water dikinase
MELWQALNHLPEIHHPNLLVGPETFDDAAIYKLNDELALVQTVDFFSPIVDDPFTFGKISAANSLSDVYAMGGKPLIALNILCFPNKTMPIEYMNEILSGGHEMAHQAGIVIAGGHTVKDNELKYGLSVTGVVHPKKYVTNSNAKIGDKLILTKPLGTGILSTSIKRGDATEEIIEEITNSMITLNKIASEKMVEIGVNACTDVTGFGLLGHSYQMAKMSNVGITFYTTDIPLFKNVTKFAKDKKYITGGGNDNKKFLQDKVIIDENISEEIKNILYDPQTSGGLLISVPEEKANTLLNMLHNAGIEKSAIIGEVTEKNVGMVVVKSRF